VTCTHSKQGRARGQHARAANKGKDVAHRLVVDGGLAEEQYSHVAEDGHEQFGLVFDSGVIASTPGSSPPERPGLDNVTSQPWSAATCPCTTFRSTYFRFVTLFLLKKARQSTRSDVTEARCVRPWLTRDIVCTGSRQLEDAYINGAPSIPGYLLAIDPLTNKSI